MPSITKLAELFLEKESTGRVSNQIQSFLRQIRKSFFMQRFITLVDFPASINYSHTAVALSQTFTTPIQKKSILVSLHCTHFFLLQ